MKMKKVMTLCLATVVGMGVLSGCGSTKSEFKQYAKCAEVSDYDGVEYVPASREVTQDKIDEKKKEHLAEEEGMQTLIDAKTSGNEVNTDEIRQQLLERGYTDEMIDGKLSSAVTSYIRNNGMSYKDMTGILDNVTDYTASGYKEFNELYSKWAEFEKDVNGWDDKKCRQQFRMACTNYFKPLYKDGNATERSRILNILSRVKASNGDKIYPKEQDIKDWGKE